MAIVDQGNIKRHLGDFCRKHGIRKLALFGSAVRGELQADSDIDVLVEFHPDQIVGLGILDMETELSQLLGGGHPVDIVNEKYLNPRLRDPILQSARVLYAEG